LDADKEGFLRSRSALIQTIGRAARNANGEALLFGDRITDSMRDAISTTQRRREVQIEYNLANGIEPVTINKSVADILGRLRGNGVAAPEIQPRILSTVSDIEQEMDRVEKEMLQAAMELRFEVAAQLRDVLHSLRSQMHDTEPDSTDPERG
jgi:excinuclease ABC subunit B